MIRLQLDHEWWVFSTNTTDVTLMLQCDDCGNYLFITASVIKRISPILSPTGQEALVPVQVYSCGNCGKVPKMFLEGSGLGLDEKINKPKEDALSRPDLG